ncbi:MAG: ABC transporter permease [Candidatus Omnitrophica bacterium]|nr:ABC transporter permease [Candidatus Omnitrophota bacterium]
MDYIFNSLKEAFILITSFDSDFMRICWTSIWVSLTSVTLAAIFSIPAAFLIAMNEFKGKKVLVIILNTLMSLPTVVVGLLVYSFLCRRGLLGDFGLLYTPYAIIIGQFILASPIITALVISTLKNSDARIIKTIRTLGATGPRSILTLVSELRLGVFAAIMAGFGRVFAEIGVSMMLGGGIKNYTRNITTAIAFETGKGEFSLALALGGVLLACAFTINALFQVCTKKYETL